MRTLKQRATESPYNKHAIRPSAHLRRRRVLASLPGHPSLCGLEACCGDPCKLPLPSCSTSSTPPAVARGGGGGGSKYQPKLTQAAFTDRQVHDSNQGAQKCTIQIFAGYLHAASAVWILCLHCPALACPPPAASHLVVLGAVVAALLLHVPGLPCLHVVHGDGVGAHAAASTPLLLA